MDAKGFIRTGPDIPIGELAAAAVGEGSVCCQLVHKFLAEAR